MTMSQPASPGSRAGSRSATADSFRWHLRPVQCALAAYRFEALFISGFGLAASAFGRPDVYRLGLQHRTSMVVVARTDASVPGEFLAGCGRLNKPDVTPCSPMASRI